MILSTDSTAAAALALALIVLVVYHLAVMRPALARVHNELRAHDEALGGGAGPLTGRLAAVEQGLAASQKAAQALENRLSTLEAFARGDLSRIGFVRYDAYDDTGSDLSYALALLNRSGDGVVLTSLYSRTETRTYGKAVQNFEPAAAASDEERRAISLAREATS
ncbi:MAG: DUF4446 family protein [Vulcanimicrobiaceae bacterium]